MKFGPDSDDRACGTGIPSGKWYGDLACMRIAGHPGEHIALVRDAALADGVQHCCRIPVGASDHKAHCFTHNCRKVANDEGASCGLKKDHSGPCVAWNEDTF